MTDALNYRVGPHTGVPLCVPDVPNNREGPQARDPEWAELWRRLAKEAF